MPQKEREQTSCKRRTEQENILWLSPFIGTSVTRWLDYFLYLAIYNNGNLPNSESIWQSRFKNVPNTSLSFKKLPKYLQSFAKVAKFRQIWSHWLALAKQFLVKYFASNSTFESRRAYAIYWQFLALMWCETGVPWCAFKTDHLTVFDIIVLVTSLEDGPITKRNLLHWPGANPKKKICRFNLLNAISKHSDWLFNFFNQSQSLKAVWRKFTLHILFKGLGPGMPKSTAKLFRKDLKQFVWQNCMHGRCTTIIDVTIIINTSNYVTVNVPDVIQPNACEVTPSIVTSTYLNTKCVIICIVASEIVQKVFRYHSEYYDDKKVLF